MDIRRLGETGLISSAIGLGSAAFTGVYGPVAEVECVRVVRLALELGITMFDAAGVHPGRAGMRPGRAGVYPGRTGVHPGREEASEALLGKALAGRRSAALIATQLRWPPGYRRLPPYGEAKHDAKHLVLASEESLRRLRTDYIDIVYPPHDLRLPIEESIAVLAGLVAAGKARHIGLCEPSADELRRAQAVHPVSVLAVEYSLRRRAAEDTLLDVAAELGVGVVACRPLGGGLLAGRNSLLVSMLDAPALRAVEAEAAALNLGIARLALAWLLTRRGDVVPVPSTRSVTHLEMNASAANINLPAGTCARLAGLFRATRP